MKAVICDKYGPPEVLRLAEVPKPFPNDNEVLVKIRATTVHIGDTKIRRLEPGMGPIRDFFFKPMMRIVLGFRGPRRSILGMELAGDIEAVGRNVTRFKPGDAVFASTESAFGAYAEYCCLNQDAALVPKPVNMSYEQAAPLSNAGITALLLFRKGNLQPGQNVLIYGASGSVGTYAVQMAKHFGARVTGVCSAANQELVKSLGADMVLDYTREDFTHRSETYDIIVDAVGKIPPAMRRKSLAKSGTYQSVFDMSGLSRIAQSDLLILKELCEAQKLKTVVDRTYRLEQIVEAHRYVEQGHKKGNVIVTV
ncbi:MAG: NAD(P)-dependent alcohol dehydrogenase [Spirochaetia bacterium]|nr:NAD(P)-dependent alcohol dehydrogenase [Spirochaetia bacterium]